MNHLSFLGDSHALANFILFFLRCAVSAAAEIADGSGKNAADASIKIVPRPKVAPVLNEDGCVAVAESIHCPPRHNIDPDLAAKFQLPIGVGSGG